MAAHRDPPHRPRILRLAAPPFPRRCRAEKLAERTEAAEITQKLLQAAGDAKPQGGKIINAYGQEEVGISRREARQSQLRSMYSQSTEKVPPSCVRPLACRRRCRRAAGMTAARTKSAAPTHARGRRASSC